MEDIVIRLKGYGIKEIIKELNYKINNESLYADYDHVFELKENLHDLDNATNPLIANAEYFTKGAFEALTRK